MTRSTKIRQLLQVVRKTRRRPGEEHRGSEWRYDGGVGGPELSRRRSHACSSVIKPPNRP